MPSSGVYSNWPKFGWRLVVVVVAKSSYSILGRYAAANCEKLTMPLRHAMRFQFQFKFKFKFQFQFGIVFVCNDATNRDEVA
ncbi:hypothetical protein V9T40_007500 [Parthenolecanium corni]|uniref:Uncharacterized protein n=1 Tax=Parthenolecanium corni TaxID=536013 RepID=A0AAN9Y5W7_9HEMI